ncbi:MAG: hypothetical protein RL637_936 [Pseudomonadota bacterium]|jgi:thiol:disulfide interchange protein DsbD
MFKQFCIFAVLSLFIWTQATASVPEASVQAHLVDETWPVHYNLVLIVPPDHHAYLDEGAEKAYLPVAVEFADAVTATALAIHKVDKPLGEYDKEVKATVLRGRGVFAIWLAQNPNQKLSSNTVKLAVNYQLCNDVTHECFRPKMTAVSLELPSINATTAATDSATTDDRSMTDQLLDLFKNHHDNLLIMFGLMWIAGLLSVATPCVYPMLPITSMFIVGRANGDASQEKSHALVYMLGMIGTYMLLGLIAGMTGGAFNTFMQSAWVNLAFAIFFAFFALALLGFYELGFMQNEVYQLDQQSAQIKGLAGTWLMGTVAGLVISPCVGPIVFALLLQVADNIAEKAAALAAIHQTLDFWGRLSIATQGSIMMGGFGLGVSLPFFLVSVIKFKLPKAGYWMDKVKYAFGIMILYFAYIYLVKGLGVWGINNEITLAFALGLVAIWIAVIHCQVFQLLPEDALPSRRMQHYIGVISLLIGGWLVFASLNNTPLANNQTHDHSLVSVANNTTNHLIETEAGISWYRNYAAAQKVALETGKLIFIDFYASWCANCTAFKNETVNNTALNQALREKAIAVKLVDKEAEFEKFRDNPQHRPLKIGLPYFAILTPKGEVKWTSTDYKATEQMIQMLSANS